MMRWLAQWLAAGIRAWVEAQGVATIRAYAQQGRDVVRDIAATYGSQLTELPVPVLAALRVVLRHSRGQLASQVLADLASGTDEVSQLVREHQMWVHDHLLRLANLLYLHLMEGTRYGHPVAPI